MTRSLCETCAWMREIITPKGSRFLLCRLAQTRPEYPKYPPQPMLQCAGYQNREQPDQPGQSGTCSIATSPDSV
jgi:hypothetical protein